MRHIFVLIGKSGVGKTTIAKRVVEDKSLGLLMPRGTTTREPRREERRGMDYDFLSLEGFKRCEDSNLFLETVTYKGNRYGFLKSSINSGMASVKDLLIILTPEGYRSFKEFFKDHPDVAVTPIVIHPPSEEKRLENLKKRGSEAKEDDEIDVTGYNGWAVCNYDLGTSVRQLKTIIKEIRQGEV
ncbi:guanylate kinase [Candidatus Liberibacter sp.]|uniref:guanylate kinase n=1 Tax=Candidatus Liberibacter sp. TaxID=34022 RepID=UPI0015F36383|nr:guanylate kinase [Candidatus Liberibacter sp.]MBA5724407.1 guanylate kinase [Candidatus Liberibacter sp.]